jgi:hypothetical protein
LRLPAESLQDWEEADGAIVQVTSQFNALELISSKISPPHDWVNVFTQGRTMGASLDCSYGSLCCRKTWKTTGRDIAFTLKV